MLCSSISTNATGPISPIITLDRVTKRFQSTTALSKISATIPPGQFVAIIGRSGAGKTTLLHCLSRGTIVTEGHVRFGACDLTALHGEMLRQHRARVGMIYQQFNLVKRLRVLDNVLVGRLPHLRGWRRYAALARVFDRGQRDAGLSCLDHVGLLARAWQRTDTLSGGEQQRVAIAKILAQEPKLILGDEPVASLDVMNGALIMRPCVGSPPRRASRWSPRSTTWSTRAATRIASSASGRGVWSSTGRPAISTTARSARSSARCPRRETTRSRWRGSPSPRW